MGSTKVSPHIFNIVAEMLSGPVDLEVSMFLSKRLISSSDMERVSIFFIRYFGEWR